VPLAELLAFGVVYYVICRLGLGMASPAREVSVIWPYSSCTRWGIA